MLPYPLLSALRTPRRKRKACFPFREVRAFFMFRWKQQGSEPLRALLCFRIPCFRLCARLGVNEKHAFRFARFEPFLCFGGNSRALNLYVRFHASVVPALGFAHASAQTKSMLSVSRGSSLFCVLSKREGRVAPVPLFLVETAGLEPATSRM